MKKGLCLLWMALISLCSNAQLPVLSIPTGHERSISCMDISKDGSLIATGSMDNSVIIWDAKTWQQLRTLSISNNAQQVLFSEDGRYLFAAAGSDPHGTMAGMDFTLWEVGSGRLLHNLPFEGNSACSFSPDNHFLAVPTFREGKSTAKGTDAMMNRMFGSQDMALWDLGKNKKLPGTVPLASNPVFVPYKNSFLLLTIGFALDGSALNFWTMRMLELDSGKRAAYSKLLEPFKSFKVKYEPTIVAAHPSASIIALGSSNGTVEIWDVEKTVVLKTFKAIRNFIHQISFSTDGKLLFVYSANGKENFVEGWNLQSGEKILSNRLTDRATSQTVRFSPSGDYYVCEEDKVAKVYNLQGNELGSLRGHALSFDNYVFSQNGRFVQLSKKGRFPKAAGPVPSPDETDEKLALSVIQTQEEYGKVKYTPAQKDSMIRQLKATWAAQREQFAPPPTPTKVWDLFYGSFLPSGGDTVRFTADSVSPDKKRKLTSKYKVTGIHYAGAAYDEAMNTTDGPRTEVDKILADTSGFFNRFINDPGSSFNRQTDYAICLVNSVSKDTLYFVAIDSSDWVITSQEGDYTASKNAASLLHYALGNNVVSLGQFDVRNNRPDKILEKIGLASKEVIEAYRNAYRKRIGRLGIDTSTFYNSFTVPVLTVLNRLQIKPEQNDDKLTLRITAADSAYKLDRFNVWVNDVPVFGVKGINLRWRNTKSFDTISTIVLSQGENRIETSVLNANGIESYRIPLQVKYLPAKPKEETSYFIGIGIDRFADTAKNLKYCVKDVRDLALKLKEKYGTLLKIDTLFNEAVTAEKVQALKKRLAQTKEDDKVIVTYSGHGLLSKNYDYFLSTYAVNFSQPEQAGLPYDELEALTDGIRARKKLLLIDACHSGEIDKEEMQRMAALQAQNKDKKGVVMSKGVKLPASKSKLGLKNSFELMQELFVNLGRSTGATVIAAAAGTQFALERGDLRNGVFTYSILEFLKTAKTTSVTELKTYVGRRVSELTNGLQQPTARAETVNHNWVLW